MNLSLIASNENYEIYLVRKSKWTYFISLPKDKYNEYNICMNFRKNTLELDTLMNKQSDVVEKINVIYNPFIKTSCVVIVPILESKYVEDFELCQINPIERNFIGNVINDAYKILSSRNYKIDNNVIFFKNQYFINLISNIDKMFKNPILIKTLEEIQDEYEYQMVVREASDIKLLDANGINIVVGTEGIVEKKESDGKVVVIPPSKDVNYITRTVGPRKEKKENDTTNN